jgi:hypothetical protein
VIVRVLTRGEDDASEGEGEPDALHGRGPFSGCDPGHDGNDDARRGDRRDDAHRADRERPVEGRDAQGPREAGQHRVREVAPLRRPFPARDHDRADEDESGQLSHRDHDDRRYNAALESPEEVGGPPGNRRAEGECDGDHAAMNGRTARKVSATPVLNREERVKL